MTRCPSDVHLDHPPRLYQPASGQQQMRSCAGRHADHSASKARLSSHDYGSPLSFLPERFRYRMHQGLWSVFAHIRLYIPCSPRRACFMTGWPFDVCIACDGMAEGTRTESDCLIVVQLQHLLLGSRIDLPGGCFLSIRPDKGSQPSVHPGRLMPKPNHMQYRIPTLYEAKFSSSSYSCNVPSGCPLPSPTHPTPR